MRMSWFRCAIAVSGTVILAFIVIGLAPLTYSKRFDIEHRPIAGLSTDRDEVSHRFLDRWGIWHSACVSGAVLKGGESIDYLMPGESFAVQGFPEIIACRSKTKLWVALGRSCL